MATSATSFVPIGIRRLATRVPFLFFRFQEPPVTTQQIQASSRKSLTLIQMLGLIGGLGLIAAIILNQLV
jgi:hypothetical protein